MDNTETQSEEVEDTKGVIKIRNSKQNRQHNGQKKKCQKDKQRSTKHTYKTKDRVKRTPHEKTGCEVMCSGRVGSLLGTRRSMNTNKQKKTQEN